MKHDSFPAPGESLKGFINSIPAPPVYFVQWAGLAGYACLRHHRIFLLLLLSGLYLFSSLLVDFDQNSKYRVPVSGESGEYPRHGTPVASDIQLSPDAPHLGARGR